LKIKIEQTKIYAEVWELDHFLNFKVRK